MGKSEPGTGYRPYMPASFRQRSHESAHAEESSDPHAAIMHPLVSQNPPEFINEQKQLEELLSHLAAAGSFAYDSEFIGELTYTPKLCLIQVASAQRVALIDPLVDLDLTGFWKLLCNPAVEKVVHAGQQDIEPIHRNAQCPAANIFDTQICAGFIGLAYPVSLSKLVYELVGARLGKGLTFTHWDQRPLSAMQLRYAADDVRYLLATRAEIGRQLLSLGHEAWARAECQALCDPAQYGFDPDWQYLKIRGCSSLAPKNQAALRQLTIWRDGCARHHEVPARSFLRDEVLFDLARSPVKSIEKLERVRGFPRPLVEAQGAQIIAAIAAGLATPTDQLRQPRDNEPTPRQRFGADALWALVQCLCAGKSIDPNLVTSRQEIGELYPAIHSLPIQSNSRLLSGWRWEAVGKQLVEILSGNATAQLRWEQTLVTRMIPGKAAVPPI